jgi:hypothetical protein
MQKLISNTDNEFFAHYIFMDNKASVATGSGFPLKVAMAGIFAPGAKGGLSMTPNMVGILIPCNLLAQVIEIVLQIK